MRENGLPKGSIAFQFLGVPVIITPFSWVALAIIGGAFGVNSAADLAGTLVFVLLGMLTLLVHEFGHALTGRAFTGGQPVIIMQALGGLTYNPVVPQRGWQYFLTVLAGPLASLLLGVLVALVLGLHIGHVGGALGLYFYYVPFNCLDEVPVDVAEALVRAEIPDLLLRGYCSALIVCFWWSLFNLLPLYPLDGGKLLATVIRSELVASAIGLVLAVAFALWSLAVGLWFNVMLGVFLAVTNFNYLRDFRRGGGGRE
ncbi:MAG: hypothetical protein Q4F30_10740 [Akkermansia sp.]|nr:hypothetical protein [Akkermansia sp.]